MEGSHISLLEPGLEGELDFAGAVVGTVDGAEMGIDARSVRVAGLAGVLVGPIEGVVDIENAFQREAPGESELAGDPQVEGLLAWLAVRVAAIHRIDVLPIAVLVFVPDAIPGPPGGVGGDAGHPDAVEGGSEPGEGGPEGMIVVAEGPGGQGIGRVLRERVGG